MRHLARSLSPNKRRLLLLYLYWLHLTERFTLPRLAFTRRVRPLQFSVLASLLMFALLPCLPFHPLTLPISFGSALSFTFIATAIRPALLFHKVGS